MNLLEVVTGNEILFTLLYCCVLLYINIDYLKEYKKINQALGSISAKEESEMLWSPDNIFVMFFVLVFNFMRSWLLYLIAIFLTESLIVLIISIVLFVIGLYDTIFNYSIEKIVKSNLKLYITIADTAYIFFLAAYLFLFK